MSSGNRTPDQMVWCGEDSVIQRVPKELEEIRRIGSTAPGALLYDAMEAFEDGDPKADENIKLMIEDGTLLDAVKTCLHAACYEYEEYKQMILLKV